MANKKKKGEKKQTAPLKMADGGKIRKKTDEEKILSTILGGTTPHQKTVNASWIALASSVKDIKKVEAVVEKYGSTIKNGEIDLLKLKPEIKAAKPSPVPQVHKKSAVKPSAPKPATDKTAKPTALTVEVYKVNSGRPGEYYGLKTTGKDGHVLYYAPNNWKTAKGALKWATNNGYNLKKSDIKKLANSTPATPEKAAQKPAAAKKAPTSVKKPAASKSAVDKLLKHSDAAEMEVSGIKPIVIEKPREENAALKVLRKVAKSGGYTVWDDVKRNGKTFATEQEAKDYASDVLKKTGKIVPVSPTDRQVTHSFKLEEEKKKK